MRAVFNQDLEKDVIDDTSGDFKRLLVAFLQGDRPEGQVFDREEARKDAQKFWEAGEGISSYTSIIIQNNVA